MSNDPAAIWTQSGLPEYYETHRRTSTDIYASEWIYLKELLVEGASILDIGCATGGFASIIGEHVRAFSYTGIDISAEMIRRARARYPQHAFHCVPEGDVSILADATFDIVLCLGILHLTRGWRALIHDAWRHTRGALVLDLRETFRASIEDETRSYMKMDFTNTAEPAPSLRLPYQIINAAEALHAVVEGCPGHGQVRLHGHWNPVSPAASSPMTHVMMNTYCIQRAQPASRG
jgi:SAM-dependent methyltransferase